MRSGSAWSPSRRAEISQAVGLIVVAALILLAVAEGGSVHAYPPAVGILAKNRNCLACHVDNGPWKDEEKTIVDILDKETGTSLRQEDGTFVITVPRGENKTVLTVLGRVKDDKAPAPYRNSWLYVDPGRIADHRSLSKFAPGWRVNLPMACRIVGDRSEKYPGAQLTVLPMTVRPTDDAQDAEIELQVMLTKGESVKGKPKKGLLANYLVRKVRLEVERSPKKEKKK